MSSTSSSVPVSSSYKLENGAALSSTPRKLALSKPGLRLSIPTPIQQQDISESQVKKIVNNCNNANQLYNSPIKTNKNIDLQSNNDNNQEQNKIKSEVEKIIKKERSTSSDKFRSDASNSAGHQHLKVNACDGDNVDNCDTNNNNNNVCLPSYSKFESDFRKRVDEMSSPNKFDMHLRGKLPNTYVIIEQQF